MKSFFIKFNVMWLGSLFFALLFLSGIQHSARFSPSDSLMWSTTYLDGIVVGVVMMGLLLLALLSWCYALWRSWKLTKSDRVFSKLRLGVLSFLTGVPIFIIIFGPWLLSAVRVITDKLVHLI